MAHIKPIARAAAPDLEAVFAGAEAAMGFLPNSTLTMAHMPQMSTAFSMLAGVLFGADLQTLLASYQQAVVSDPLAQENLTPDQIQLIAYSVSLSAGCRYCQAHTSHNAHRAGVSEEKLAQLLNYETSALFSASEKALIGLALAAGQVPNETSSAHFDTLKQHFTERQIVQVVGIISLFGFLNRWNDTMATALEHHPDEFARRVLADGGWQPGKHTEV